MKNQFLVASMLLLSYCSYSQIQPYVDVNAVWVVPKPEGKVGLDLGINFKRISFEANGLFIGKSRMGATLGYQFGERGGEYVGMRVYVGIVYGNFYNSSKEDAVLVKERRHTGGVKLMQGSLALDLKTITNLREIGQSEFYLSAGFQIVEIIKWANR